MKCIHDYLARIHGRGRGATTRGFPAALPMLIAVFWAASPALRAADLDRVVLFNIKAQALEKALLQFGAQEHVQMSVAMDSGIRKLKAPDLRGSYTGREALIILLRGTQLTFDIKGDIVEVSNEAKAARQSHDPPPSSRAAESVPLTESDSSAKRNRQSNHSLLKEVVVTGSRLAMAAKNGPQEVQVYDRAYIEQSGQVSVADFLSTLPSVSVTVPPLLRGVTTVRLRGLPVGTTLVLIDGRRVENSAGSANGQYFDLSNIPIEAIQRIEVVENGSSAVYGSDAIAGVVNIILRKDFSGIAADASYDWAKDVKNVRSSLAFGKQGDRSGLSIVGSYETDGGLLNYQRALSSSNNYTSYGGPNRNFPDCPSADAYSLTGDPLPGAPAGSSATYAAVTGSTTTGTPPFTQFTYGTLNECPILDGISLIPTTKRGAIIIQGHQQVAPDVTLFTEILYSHTERIGSVGYNSLFGVAGFQEFTVGASNPFNPFGTDVGVSADIKDAPIVETLNTDFFRPLVGIKGTIADRWDWELSAWQSADWTLDRAANEFPDEVGLQNALNSSNPSTALNPFVTGPIGSPSLLNSLFSAENAESTGSDRSAEAFIRGSALRLPAGDVQVAIGGDFVYSTLHFNTSGGTGAYTSYNTISTYHRRYYATFAEIKVPVIAGATSSSGSLLDFTASGRRDKYSDFGSDTTGQLGVEIRPIDGILIRGTYGTAFSAPSLMLLHEPDSVINGVISDPVTGAPKLVEVVSGGNPNLRPMDGRSHSIGAVYSSSTVPGLMLSVTQWDVKETNVTQSLAAQVIVDDLADFSSRIVRDSSGQIVQVNDTEVNFGSIDVGGIDYQLEYKHSVGPGVGSIDLGATETYHYEQALTPSAQPIESVSLAQNDTNWAPRWKANPGLGWSEGSVSARIDGRYTGDYRDYNSQRLLGNVWLFDANVHLSVGRWIGVRADVLRGAYIEVGGTNLFNRGPEFSTYGNDFYGYDAAQMSLVGRTLYLNGGVRW